MKLSDKEELVEYYGEGYKLETKLSNNLLSVYIYSRNVMVKTWRKEEMERIYNQRYKSPILIDDADDGKANEKLPTDGNRTSTSKIDTLLREVKKSKNKNSKHIISGNCNSCANQNNDLVLLERKEKINT